MVRMMMIVIRMPMIPMTAMRPAFMMRMRVVFVRQEGGIDFQFVVQVESAQVEHFADRHLAEIHLANGRARIDALQARGEYVDRFTAYRIGLRQQQPVGETGLALCFFMFIQLLHSMLCIDDGNYGIQHVMHRDFVVHEEGLCHGAGIGQARGFDDEVVELQLPRVTLLRERAEREDEVAPHRAADAPVVHLDDLLIAVLYQDFVVDVFLAEFILDDRNLVSVRLAQAAVEKGGLAGAEKAGQYGRGYHYHINVRNRRTILLS